MTQNEYEDIMRDGFPEDEPNLCRECGEELNAIEDKLCADCVTKAASYYGLAEEYLKAQPKRMGHTSWIDFILRYVLGINDCDDAELILDLVDDLMSPELAFKDGTVSDLLFEYVLECRYEFQQWVESRIDTF